MDNEFLFQEAAEAAKQAEQERKANEIPWAEYVRLIQLFYNEVEEACFRACWERLALSFNMENMSDVVLEALRHQYRSQTGEEPPEFVPRSREIVPIAGFAEQAEAVKIKITMTQWTNLLNAGLSSGLTLEQIVELVDQKYSCRVRDLLQSQYEEAMQFLKEQKR